MISATSEFLFEINLGLIGVNELSNDELPSSTKNSIIEMSPILVTYFIGFFIFRGFFSNFPLYLQLKFDLTDTEAVNDWALISGIALFVGGLSRIPAGLISDKIGRVNAIMIAYLVYTGSLLIILFIPNNPSYIVGLSLIRFGNNIYAMTGRGVVSRTKRDTGLKNGLLASMVGIASFGGPTILAWSLDNYPPDYILYIAMGLLIADFLVFTISLKFIPSLFKIISPNDIFDLDLSPIKRDTKLNLKDSISQDGIPEILFLFFATGLNFGLITTVYSIYGYNILKIDLSILGLIIGSGSLIPVIWAPFVGILYRYVRDEMMRLLSWSLLFFGSIMIVFSQFSVYLFFFGYILVNMGNSSYFTMEITRMNKEVELQNFSFVFGLASSLVIIGTSIASFVSVPLYNWMPEGNFIAGTILSFISLILVSITSRKWSNQRKIRNSENSI